MVATPYDVLGEDGVRRLATRFYENMSADPAAAGIRNMHEPNLAPVTEKLTQFLRGWVGGPRDYFEREGAPCMLSVHRRLPIGADEANQWVNYMRRALDDIGAPSEVREMLLPAFRRMAEAMQAR